MTFVKRARYPARGNQARYVKAELSGLGTYMIPMGHLVRGSFDEARFRNAARALVERHEALRTRFSLEDGALFALVASDAPHQCHVTSLQDQSLTAFRDWAIPLVFQDVDPTQPGSLIRFMAADLGESWRFTIAGHHAITDGISRGVMNKELLKLYAGELLPPAASYYDFSIPSGPFEQSQEDALSVVDGLPKPPRLIGDGSGEDGEGQKGLFVEHDFGPLQRQISRVAKSIGTSKFGFLTAVYALGLRGYSGDNAVSSFFQSAGRKSLGAPLISPA